MIGYFTFQITSISKTASLIRNLKEATPRLSQIKVTAGFDGFVDQIVKIIRYKEEGIPPVFFETKKEFADYIHEKEGASFSVEVQEQFIKLGGNMPIMANALATLGFEVNCIGALGYPQIHPVFHQLSQNCKMFSFANPGYSTAYEFHDGKILMGHFGELHASGWEIIKNRIGLNTIVELINHSELLSFVNWSEIDASTDIWKGLIREVLPATTSRRPLAFFDLSDCTKRSDVSVKEALELIGSISQFAKVIIGMNRNEARHICTLIEQESVANDLTEAGKVIFEKLQPYLLVVHSATEAVAFDSSNLYKRNSFHIKNPLISTGAGDNFNAGFCTAQLLQLDAEASLLFANVIAGLYVKNGVSPRMIDAIDFLGKLTH